MNEYSHVIELLVNQLCLREITINSKGKEQYIYYTDIKKLNNTRKMFKVLLEETIDEDLEHVQENEVILYSYEFEYGEVRFSNVDEIDLAIKNQANERMKKMLDCLPKDSDNLEYTFTDSFLLGVYKTIKKNEVLIVVRLYSDFVQNNYTLL